MPNGKVAGIRCTQLAEDEGCKLFGKSERPEVCKGFMLSKEMCKTPKEEALAYLTDLEMITDPNKY